MLRQMHKKKRMIWVEMLPEMQEDRYALAVPFCPPGRRGAGQVRVLGTHQVGGNRSQSWWQEEALIR